MSLTNYTLGGDRLMSLEHPGSGVGGHPPLSMSVRTWLWQEPLLDNHYLLLRGAGKGAQPISLFCLQERRNAISPPQTASF